MDQATAERIARALGRIEEHLTEVNMMLFVMMTPAQQAAFWKMKQEVGRGADEIVADHMATGEMERGFGPGPPPWEK